MDCMDFNIKKIYKILIPQFSKLQLYDTKFRRLSDENKTYEVQLNLFFYCIETYF